MASVIYNRARTYMGKCKPLALAALRVRALAQGMVVRTEGTAEQQRICIRSRDRMVILAAHHYHYVQDILDDFDYYFGAVECREEKGTRVVDFSRPAEHVLSPSGLKFFFTSLPESCVTTELYTGRAPLHRGDIVFDVGAFCGATAYFFSKTVGDEGRVFSFEPDPHNFLALQRNIASHRLRNVTAINKGLWSTTTSLDFQAEGNLGSSVATRTGRRNSLRRVSVLSLDDALDENCPTRLDFIKMDIEGAEVEVLKGAKRLWERFRPDLVIEPHLVNGVLTTSSVCHLLKERGYECEIMAQARLRLPLIYASAGR